MSNHSSYYQPKFLNEIQLGLVVHSGVSLAIYTHGVCQEFYNVVRGRGIYKLVKALIDADVVVDLISGSSAGGINGILLSYALTNSNAREVVDFSAFASIWRNSGEILKLLRQPNSLADRVETLGTNGNNFYQHEVGKALVRANARKMPRPQQEWFSAGKELDLTISGTNYLGKIDRTIDDTGINLNVKNHRTLFHLKHRQGRKEPFNPEFSELGLPRTPLDTYTALAKLCQITAGIPMIFPLVEVDIHDRQNLVDRQIATWGKLDRHDSLDRTSSKLYFLDGGLLDNAPFTYSLNTTYYRLPQRPGQRKFFYIDPNPEHLADRVQLRGNKKSRADRILQATAQSMPIQQSIANDLRTIQEHNHKVRRYQATLDSAETAIDSQKLLASSDLTQDRIYLRGRLFDFRERNLPLLLHSDLAAQNQRYSTIVEKIESVIINKIGTSKDRDHYHKLLDRFESQVVDLDVEYSLRQHFYLIDRIAELPAKNRDRETDVQLQHLSLQLSCNVKLLEVIRAGLQLMLGDRSISNYFYFLINQEPNNRRLRALVYELIFRLHRFLFDARKFQEFFPPAESQLQSIPDDFWQDLPKFAGTTITGERWLSQTQISSLFAQIQHRITNLHHSNALHPLIWADNNLAYDEDANRSFPSILKQISQVAVMAIGATTNQYTDELLKQWYTFNIVDRELYPFEYLTNLTEKKIISPLCISPENAQMGIGQGKNARDKLSGDRLYSIGGFFKRSWRSNDLLWGRLDGLNRILEGVITPRSVTAFANFVQREASKTSKTPDRYIDWLITESLPHVSGLKRQKITKHLEYLAQPELQIDRLQLRDILADLVLAGHREILTNDIHSIVEGMEEQPGWWRLPRNLRSAAETVPTEIKSQGIQIPISNSQTIVRIVHQSLTNLAAQRQNFFRNQYRFSIDKLWEQMPLVPLVKICSQGILALRNILVKVFGSDRYPQTRKPLYNLLDRNLQSIYWWLQGNTVSPSTSHRRSQIIFLQLIGIISTIVGIILALILSPLWLIFALIGAIGYWILQNMRLRHITNSIRSQFLPPRE